MKKVFLPDAWRRASDLAFAKAHDLKGSVEMWHYDGSHFKFNHAIHEQMGEWHIIVTEHHGEHVYHNDEIHALEVESESALTDAWYQGERVDIQPEVSEGKCGAALCCDDPDCSEVQPEVAVQPEVNKDES